MEEDALLVKGKLVISVKEAETPDTATVKARACRVGNIYVDKRMRVRKNYDDGKDMWASTTSL